MIDALSALVSTAPALGSVGVVSTTPLLVKDPLTVSTAPLGTVPPDAKAQYAFRSTAMLPKFTYFEPNPLSVAVVIGADRGFRRQFQRAD